MCEKTTIAIVPGWAEGAWHTKGFKDELNSHGVQVTKNPRDANVIIAHSAGCYFVADLQKAKHIILIGLPYWPGRTLIGSLVRKLYYEFRHHHQTNDMGWWINKLVHNIMYIFTKPRITYKSIVYRWQQRLPTSRKGQEIILIRNSGDTFCHPKIVKIFEKANSYRYIEMPGPHDDCWKSPNAYIDLLKKELKLKDG